MAAKKGVSGKSDQYLMFKKLFAGVAMLAFIVILIAGLKANARLVTIAYRATIVMVVILFVNRVVIKVLSGYEEMNSGKAETDRS
jgi:apolipoprotein N-acyltransferase